MALTPSGSQIDNPGGSGGGVTSVNTLTGAVVITASIVGAVPRPNTRRWAYFCADGTAGLPVNKGIGDILQANVSSGGIITGGPATSTLPAFVEVETGTTGGNQGHLVGGGGGVISIVGRNLRYQIYAANNTSFATTNRVWLGLTNNNLYGSDTNTSVAFAAFRASTSASDANWQCVTCTGGGAGHETITDSGVAVNSSFHKFEIVFNDSVPNVQFFIDGTLVATTATNLPAAGTLVFWFGSVDNISSPVNRTLLMAWGYTESDF